MAATMSGANTLTSGTLHMTAIYLVAGDVLTNLKVRGGSSGWATVTHSWGVLTDASLNVVAVTPDDTTATLGVQVTRTFAFTSPYTVPTTGLYYVGVMVAGGTTTTLGASAMASAQNGIPPISVATSSTGQTTPPSVGATMGALTSTTTGPYVWLT
jgi:hypothetical protein